MERYYYSRSVTILAYASDQLFLLDQTLKNKNCSQVSDVIENFIAQNVSSVIGFLQTDA